MRRRQFSYLDPKSFRSVADTDGQIMLGPDPQDSLSANLFLIFIMIAIPLCPVPGF
jgi:hypothetical protein